MLRTKLTPYLIALLTTSCAAGQSPNDFCLEAHPIYVDSRDHFTPETGRQILAHDEKGRVQCGWKVAQ